MFGRVHLSQRNCINQLTSRKSLVHKKVLLAHWRQYSSMVLALFTTRQTLVNSPEHSARRRTACLHSVLTRRALRSLETGTGIEADTVVDQHGNKITSSQQDPTECLLARERTILNSLTSAPLREMILPVITQAAKPTTTNPPLVVSREASMTEEPVVPVLIGDHNPSIPIQLPYDTIDTSHDKTAEEKRANMERLRKLPRHEQLKEFTRPRPNRVICGYRPIPVIDPGYDPFLDPQVLNRSKSRLTRPEPNPFRYKGR